MILKTDKVIRNYPKFEAAFIAQFGVRMPFKTRAGGKLTLDVPDAQADAISNWVAAYDESANLTPEEQKEQRLRAELETTLSDQHAIEIDLAALENITTLAQAIQMIRFLARRVKYLELRQQFGSGG